MSWQYQSEVKFEELRRLIETDFNEKPFDQVKAAGALGQLQSLWSRFSVELEKHRAENEILKSRDKAEIKYLEERLDSKRFYFSISFLLNVALICTIAVMYIAAKLAR